MVKVNFHSLLRLQEKFKNNGKYMDDSNPTNEESGPVHHLSDSELSEALLEGNVKAEEPSPESEEHSNIEQGPKDTKAEVAEEPKRTESSPQEDKIYVSKKEYEQLQKQNTHGQQFIQRQASQITELQKARQALEGRLNELSTNLDQVALENPIQAVDNRMEMYRLQQEHQANLAYERELISRQVVDSHITPRENLLQDMVEVLRSDGLDDGFVSQFAQNAYNAAQPETLIQLAKRAEDRRALKEASAKIAELEERLKRALEKPASILQKLSQNASKPPPVSAKTGGAVAKPSISEAQIANLSDTELNELLEQKNG